MAQQRKTYKADEQKLKNAILKYIQMFPRKGFAWSQYNGAVYDAYRGCYRKPSQYARKGVPDICGMWGSGGEGANWRPARPLYIEVKTAKGVVSEDQRMFINQAISHGAIAFVCRDLSHAIKVLDSFGKD